jgi:carbamate kinase
LDATETIVVALGGNALLRQGEKGSFEEQYHNIENALVEVVDLIERGYQVVLTHGNGPQVGATLLRHKRSDGIYPALPLHACNAETQGLIGYMIEQALQNELNKRHLNKRAIALITRTTVDKNDQAFQKPTKPVGRVFIAKEMIDSSTFSSSNNMQLVIKKNYSNSRQGYRILVPSPKPKSILEYQAIRTLVDAGFIVIACGGGGIPVVEMVNGSTSGIDAVIDKDLASERLATAIHATKLLLLTDVDGLFENYGKRNQKLIREIAISKSMTLGMLRLQQGSIAPKVQACTEFIRNGGNEAIIASVYRLSDALSGISGTHFVP